MAVAYIITNMYKLYLLIMVTITDTFTLKSSNKTQQFSAMKFNTSYEKNMSFPVIPKSSKIEEKVEK